MKKMSFLYLAVLLAATGCSQKADKADAYGTFEATEIVISAETSGKIISFRPTEGSDITKDQTIAKIDTTLFLLQKGEINAAMHGIRTRLTSIDAQNAIISQQLDNLNINIVRTRKMLSDGAATTKQLDDLTGQAAVLEKQVAANNTQKASVSAELQLYESKKATLDEQIARCNIRSPLNGTLIEKYAEEGEVTAAGKPLARIADLSLMKLRVYVSGSMLGEVKTGAPCTVRIDNGEKGYTSMQGTVSYISGKAEFTPKIIQTKEERVTLVYPVLIEVNNDGAIKSGMPGEAIF